MVVLKYYFRYLRYGSLCHFAQLTCCTSSSSISTSHWGDGSCCSQGYPIKSQLLTYPYQKAVAPSLDWLNNKVMVWFDKVHFFSG